MAVYKHKETGETIVTDSELKGSWELVEETKPKSKKKE